MSIIQSGNRAFITGAGSGIGRALAQALAARGMRLALADLSLAKLAQTRQLLGGAEVMLLEMDVRDPQAFEHHSARIWAEWGGIDLLCNNAGIITPDRDRAVWEFGAAEWQAMWDVNVMGIIHALNAMLPLMQESGRPAHIVNLASVAGLVSGAAAVPYSVSKHAVVRLSEGLLAGLQQRGLPIGVSCICPGMVRTEIFDASGAQAEQDEAGRFRFPQGTMEAADLAQAIIAAIGEGRFYLLPHEGFDAKIRQRFTHILARQTPDYRRG